MNEQNAFQGNWKEYRFSDAGFFLWGQSDVIESLADFEESINGALLVTPFTNPYIESLSIAPDMESGFVWFNAVIRNCTNGENYRVYINYYYPII